ncbi:hypothetical protein Golob_006665 [Gossypium lobatum]|uniref:ATP-dependent DNA ligase family profile domain-containing protein n=1 Tax=Gossypium lobatum TaxID=34289 RepID=A0A7J8MX09_9ROSI|nr:hypothetical protein [Gossypium lobatum]
MFPDVVIAVSRSKKSGVKSFVLDYEIVAYDLDKHETLPYKILSTRRRKHSTNPKQKKIEKFLKAAMDANCESLVIKGLNDAYEPSTYPWLKLKKEYMEGIGDSIAAYHGRSSKQALTSCFLWLVMTASFEGDSKTEAGMSPTKLNWMYGLNPRSFFRVRKDKDPEQASSLEIMVEIKLGNLSVDFIAEVKDLVYENGNWDCRIPRTTDDKECKWDCGWQIGWWWGSVLQAELSAVYDGLMVAWDLSYGKLSVECDSVANVIKGRDVGHDFRSDLTRT